MTSARVPQPPGGAAPQGFDRELDLRGIRAFGVGLVVVTIVLLGVVWLLIARFRQVQTSRDPRPSPLAEANVQRLPPGPRLQISETADMVALRREEDATLRSYGWIDRGAGIGRIPIDRAMEILAASGLEAAQPAAPPARRHPPRRRRTR